MTEDAYRQALHAAQSELARLEERRASLLRLIENLSAIAEEDQYELTPPPGYVPQGLTEEIRTILNLTTVPLWPTEIRDALITRGFKASSPKNLLINVHTVISRLHDARELDPSDKDGKTAYKLKPTLYQLEALMGLTREDIPKTPAEARATLARALARRR